MIGNPRSSLHVHVHGGLWAIADSIAWDENGEWGVASIASTLYDVIHSFDGDGYTQMADNEIPRFYDALSVVRSGQNEVL